MLLSGVRRGLDASGVGEMFACRMLRRKQSARTAEQAGPSGSDLPTPCRELFGPQPAPARDPAIEIDTGHIVGLFSLEIVESVHVAYLATGSVNPLERILPSFEFVGTAIRLPLLIVPTHAAINNNDAAQQYQR